MRNRTCRAIGEQNPEAAASVRHEGQMNEKIYDRLKQTAKAGLVTTYSEIAPLAGLDMGRQDDRNKIAEILGEISTHEHRQGRPMLSVVVIHKENNIPGQGFFTLARELGLFGDDNEFMFFVRELRRVHDFWKRK